MFLKKVFRVIKKRIGLILIKIFELIQKTLPIRKNIVFECESDMDDNPRAVYEYLIEKGYNKNHKLIWIVKNVELCKKMHAIKNVVFISRFDKTLKNTIKLNYYLYTSKWFIFSHPWWFKKRSDKQVVIYITHGSGIKGRDQKVVLKNDIYDWKLIPRKLIGNHTFVEKNMTDDGFFLSGYPRLDFFYKGSKSIIINKFFNYNDKEKIILCMPTYKQSTMINDSDVNDKYSLSFIKSEDELYKLNGLLNKNKIHIIIKLHPLQEKEDLFLDDLTNIHYLTNAELFEKDVLLYELVGKCDALITDLSSIYTDYLYLDRPIGFLMENILNYKRGYNVPNPLDYMPGIKIYNFEDFIKFLNNVVVGDDGYSEERKKIFDFFHFYNQNNNSEKFCKWLIPELK